MAVFFSLMVPLLPWFHWHLQYTCSQLSDRLLVTRDPGEGPSRILTIHVDGNLSSTVSTQFSEGTGPEGFVGFSDQQGAWEKAGNQQIEATVLDFEYDLSDGTFLGTARAHYVLKFDKSFQIVEGTVEGEVFAPGADPLHPSDATPIAQFTDEFTAQRVSP
jgi:hypothetical protein